MINIVTGDLLKATQNIIGHQVNSKGVMGKGVAKQVKEQFPFAFESYKEFCSNQSTLLGKAQIVKISDDKYICNLFGQDDYSKLANVLRTQFTDYDSLQNALQELKSFAKENNLSVALPYKIGCDLGGGDWMVVIQIIEKVFSDYEVTLYSLEDLSL